MTLPCEALLNVFGYQNNLNPENNFSKRFKCFTTVSEQRLAV